MSVSIPFCRRSLVDTQNSQTDINFDNSPSPSSMNPILHLEFGQWSCLQKHLGRGLQTTAKRAPGHVNNVFLRS